MTCICTINFQARGTIPSPPGFFIGWRRALLKFFQWAVVRKKMLLGKFLISDYRVVGANGVCARVRSITARGVGRVGRTRFRTRVGLGVATICFFDLILINYLLFNLWQRF